MEHLFSLNAEGGPLLCIDANAATLWKGADEGANDYDNLCAEIDKDEAFSAMIFQIGRQPGVVWEMAGAGTADVYLQHNGTVVIVRPWLSENTSHELMKVATEPPLSRQKIGAIEIPSGILAILWSPESGENIPQKLDTRFHRVLGTAINGSVFALKLPKMCYTCYDERVHIGVSQARRLRLTPN